MAPSQADVLAILRELVLELQQQRQAIQELEQATWIRYAQEIGRSTIPGGMRVDVLLVLGAAGATGILGVQGDTVGRVLGALVGGTAP
jgi:hypothetical protein